MRDGARHTVGVTCVDPDWSATGALCVEHLAELGHQDVAVFGEAPAVYERHSRCAKRTLDGLRSRAREPGLKVLRRPREGGYDATAVTPSRIFDERPRTTGFVMQNESAVEPLLAVSRRQGRAVPEDVSVVAVQASERLTSAAVPAQETGRHAVGLLMGELDGAGRTARCSSHSN
ncbi:substrate-binding domain-containing protein [Streptomyces sennicomposti]